MLKEDLSIKKHVNFNFIVYRNIFLLKIAVTSVLGLYVQNEISKPEAKL